jgi:hypothetical protein
VSDDLTALQRQLREARENLALIEERESQYVLSTDVPLQLVKERRRLEGRVAWLARRLDELQPIAVLRRATKLLVGPVAEALTGAPWKRARQRLLTQASRLPRASHLDTALMQASVNDLLRLDREIRVLLEAHHIEPNSGQLEALERRAGRLADTLLRIYRLEPGELPELERLTAEEA